MNDTILFKRDVEMVLIYHAILRTVPTYYYMKEVKE